jgi:CheY-like chemotaxis protein
MAVRKEVVVIDDDEGIREAFKLALELGDYRVHTAADGREGLALLDRIPTPCVIFLDLMMPNMDGWAFADALRRDARLRGVALVVVTAFVERARDFERAKAVLEKPVSLAALLDQVAQHCGERA